MKIAFVWQGFDGKYGQWRDGLRGAMDIIEQKHEVQYFDTTRVKDIYDFKPDFVLYWEAPCTFVGKDRMNYWAVQSLPFKKGLLFAGGPVKDEYLDCFDMFFLESKINEQEFQDLGKPWVHAFGVDTRYFKPIKQPKVFDGVFQATCASWKRPWLAAEALKDKYAVMGRFQEEDPIGFIRVRAAGGVVLPELSADAVAAMLCTARTCTNTSDYWGGGQRATLEAMACGIPVLVMEDSPKCREFVEESGFGAVCASNVDAIRAATRELIEKNLDPQIGVDYINSKWTHEHYAQQILDGIAKVI